MKKLLLMAALLFALPLMAGFTNNGKMQMNTLNLKIGGTLDNNGELIGIEHANIECNTLTGAGLISSPSIVLKTNLFAYTGTIECDGTCLIVASQPFDETMFKRSGTGQFAVVIEKLPRITACKECGRSIITDDELLDE